MKPNRCTLGFAVGVMVFVLTCVANAQDADRTYTHPAEANQTKNLTFGPGSYDFRTDPEPNTYLYVEWFNTYSGTAGLIDSAYLYFYDDTTVNIISNGWVRAEVYRSDFWNNKYEW